jgi:hypothetical protein
LNIITGVVFVIESFPSYHWALAIVQDCYVSDVPESAATLLDTTIL